VGEKKCWTIKSCQFSVGCYLQIQCYSNAKDWQNHCVFRYL